VSDFKKPIEHRDADLQPQPEDQSRRNEHRVPGQGIFCQGPL